MADLRSPIDVATIASIVSEDGTLNSSDCAIKSCALFKAFFNNVEAHELKLK